MCVCVLMCLTPCDPMDCSPPGSSLHGILQGKNTGVGYHFLLQGIFLIQVSNLHLCRLLHWQEDSLLLVPPGKPKSLINVIKYTNCMNFQ